MKHVLISGEIGVGKSTLLKRVLDHYGIRVEYGFRTKKQQPGENGSFGIYIHPAGASELFYSDKNMIALIEKRTKTRFPKSFDDYGASLLKNIPEGSLVIMDELGVLESKSLPI